MATSRITFCLRKIGNEAVLILLLLLATVSVDGADYEGRFDYINYGDSEIAESSRRSSDSLYPDIKYKAFQAKQSIDDDYAIEFTEAPKLKKIGKTRLRPPTKKAVSFQPTVNEVGTHLKPFPQPVEDSDMKGAEKNRRGRWNVHTPESELSAKRGYDEYDYVSEKLHTDDKRDREYEDAEVLYPEDKEEGTKFDDNVIKDKTISFLTAPIQLSRVSEPRHPEAPFLLKAQTTHRYTRPFTTRQRTKDVVSQSYKPEYLDLEMNDLNSVSVIPLTKETVNITNPPVFAKVHEDRDQLPVMVLPERRSVEAIMVPEGSYLGPEVEIARKNIRESLLRRGVDPSSDLGELVCEYVQANRGVLNNLITPLCMYFCLFVTVFGV